MALTISDAMFAVNGSLGYDDNDHSGLWGDVILVNGKPWPVMKVQKRVYRFRILNSDLGSMVMVKLLRRRGRSTRALLRRLHRVRR